MIKAMILAAGRGERMGDLTKNCPKSLLQVHGEALIVHHLKKLAALGIQECLINLRYLGEKIQRALGNGSQFGIKLTYSVETEALETAGGIIQALPFFENHAFILVSADVWTTYPFEHLLRRVTNLNQAHLVLVDNPDHHQQGDFSLQNNGLLSLDGKKLNYAGIGLFHPRLFENYASGYRKLGDVLKTKIPQEEITGEYYPGSWLNVDTAGRLALANSSRSSIVPCDAKKSSKA